MYRLYVMETAPLMGEENKKRAAALVTQERRRRALAMRQETGRAECLAAGLLLSYALFCEEREPLQSRMVSAEEVLGALEKAGGCGGEISIGKRPGGKPYLEDREGLFFSLSHSQGFAACVLSCEEIGMDIQYRGRKLQTGIERRILHPEECISDRQQLFDIWAAKEAYVKYTGTGLSKDFRELRTDFSKKTVTDTAGGEICRLYMGGMEGLSADYALAVCTPAI